MSKLHISEIQSFINSANIIINDAWVLSFEDNNTFNIPMGFEDCWNGDEEAQDKAVEFFNSRESLNSLLNDVGLLDIESVEELVVFAKEKGIYVDKF